MEAKSKKGNNFKMDLFGLHENVTWSKLNLKFGEVKAQWELLSDAKLVDLALRSNFFPIIRRPTIWYSGE